MPSYKQINDNRSVAEFSPVQGGIYYNSILSYESGYGLWWGSEAYNGALRYRLAYDGGSLYTSYGDGTRFRGLYIRCVSEEKTVTDLTYMQNMASLES